MRRAALLIGYLAALLALDHFASYPEQIGLGVASWALLLALAWRLPVFQRAMVLGVVCFATIGEVTGSLIWGVYRYRLHNLPLFVPPAHGLVYLAGLAIAASLAPPSRVLVLTAAVVCRSCSCSSGARATARSTRASSSSSRPSSSTGRRSAPGGGHARCPDSGSRTATRPRALRRAMSGST